MTTTYHHPSAERAMRSPIAFAGGQGVPRPAMAVGLTRAPWVCDPSRTPSLAAKRDTKWEVDSEAEGAGS